MYEEEAVVFVGYNSYVVCCSYQPWCGDNITVIYEPPDQYSTYLPCGCGQFEFHLNLVLSENPSLPCWCKPSHVIAGYSQQMFYSPFWKDFMAQVFRMVMLPQKCLSCRQSHELNPMLCLENRTRLSLLPPVLCGCLPKLPEGAAAGISSGE